MSDYSLIYTIYQVLLLAVNKYTGVVILLNETKYELRVRDDVVGKLFNDRLFRDGISQLDIHKHRFQHVRKLLGEPQQQIIADIGIFPGTSLYYFGENNHIVGYGKTNKKFIKKIEELGHENIEVDFELNETLDSDKKADIVLCQEIIEHIRMPKNFFTRIDNLVNEGGVLYISTNNASYIGYIVKLLLTKPILDPIESESSFYPGHMRYYHCYELVNFLRSQGYTIRTAANINFLPQARYYRNRIFGVVKNTLVRLMPRLYASHFEIVAVKNRLPIPK